MKPLHYFVGRNTSTRDAFYAAAYHDGILIKQWGKGDWKGDSGQIRSGRASEQAYMDLVNEKMANGYRTVYSGTFKDWGFSNLDTVNTMRKLAQEIPRTHPDDRRHPDPVPDPVPDDHPEPDPYTGDGAQNSRLPRAKAALTSAKVDLRTACDRVLALTDVALRGEDMEMIEAHQVLQAAMPELRDLLSELESYVESFNDIATLRLGGGQ